MADVVDIPEFRAFYYTDDTPRQFYTLRRYEDESGSGKMHCYNIAPGIQLSFNDLNLSSCYQPLNVQKDFLEIIYVFLTIFLYLLKCPQSFILSALRAFCFCGKPRISRSIFLYFRYQAWLKSW